jgi:hypothetical protein
MIDGFSRSALRFRIARSDTSKKAHASKVTTRE